MTGWLPVADHHDVIERHVARTMVHGHELAVWRADDGNLNVWENRCLHRGVRLSIGVNDGAELVCRYHAWRYANRSGGCTYIPAHPADSPPRTVHCATFPVAECHGLVWTRLDAVTDAEPPVLDELAAGSLVLRARAIPRAADEVVAALAASDLGSVLASGEGWVAVDTSVDAERETTVFFVQPVDDGRSVVRPVRAGVVADPGPVWRRHARALARFAERLTSRPASQRVVSAPPTPVALPTTNDGRDATFAVRIASAAPVAAGIRAFALVDVEGRALPAIQPGDHIDVHLPGGLVRQYSLTNAPGQTDAFRIAVKRTVDSAGGSRHLHEQAEIGDVIEVSAPKNRFPLRRNVPHTVLLAGGIGITPIIAMAQALARGDLDFELHYFAASRDELAFTDVLESFGAATRTHLGLDPAETRARLATTLPQPRPDTQILACGPPPMLDAIRSLAAEAGWPDDAVTVEYFGGDAEIDQTSAFTVELARSALRVEVPGGVSLLDALRAAGVAINSSCEQGACGTCAAPVIEGEPLHHDVYLTATERAAGDTILTCVSRAGGGRLVLDL